MFLIAHIKVRREKQSSSAVLFTGLLEVYFPDTTCLLTLISSIDLDLSVTIWFWLLKQNGCMKNGSADDTEKDYTAMHFVVVLLVPSDTSLWKT